MYGKTTSSPIKFREPVAAYAFHHYQQDLPINKLHRHQVIELGYCLSGSGIFVIEGKTYNYTHGDIAIISEVDSHLARSVPGTESEWLFIHFDPAFACFDFLRSDLLDTSCLSGPDFINIISEKNNLRLAAAIRDFFTIYQEKPENYTLEIQALTAQILVMLHRLQGRSDVLAKTNNALKEIGNLFSNSSSKSASPGNNILRIRNRKQEILSRISPALELISKKYMEPLQLSDLTACCNLSEPHFRRIFREYTGFSPMEYLIHWRVRMAVATLNQEAADTIKVSMTDLSLQCGFNSISGFNRHFKKIMGCSPRVYTRQSANEMAH